MSNYPEYEDDFDFGTNMADVDENAGGGYGPMPAGKYGMQAVEVAVKDGKDPRNGKMVAVTFQVVDGSNNRKIFENYCLQHTNDTTKRIAEQAVKQWMKACGYTGNERLTAGLLKTLEGREFTAHVIVEKSRDPQYGDRNRIRQFEPSGGYAPQQSSRPAPAPQQRPAPVPPQQRPAPAPQQQRPAPAQYQDPRQAAPSPQPQPAQAAIPPRPTGGKPWERRA
ncbi:DUF669 domain-containing protein [Methylomagnum ishizawai]|uniref:DUF669 domain-containing protein n=1 Tax=Methylomagnum ishizawai TaxID=1760988 RepID=UPI001C33DEEB|nr:DUF669 domain-containing protein [Methylomagnum ishizawai]BBL75471.1 hypothetical protein MishRS11D_25690 [Methylomagnum ishizawai]